MEILIICCTAAVIYTLVRIADDTPERRREKAAQAQADREYAASVRFAAAQAARTPAQVAADAALDAARCDVDTALWHAMQYEGATDHRGVSWWVIHAARNERLTQAIEGRQAAFSTVQQSGGACE